MVGERGKAWGLANKGIFLCLVTVFLAGCPPREFPDEPVPRVEGPRQLLYPVEIKIHSSSAVVRKDGRGDFDGIAVACEAHDRFGDSIKALGVMRFEVYNYAQSQPGNRGQRMGFWPDMRIDSLETIQKHWDKVWGLYRFNLTWDRQVKPNQRFILEVTLTTPEGRQLSDTHAIQAGP